MANQQALRLKHFGCITAIMLLLAALILGSASHAAASTPPPSKNDQKPAAPVESARSYSLQQPEPYSKNSANRNTVQNLSGAAFTTTPDAQTKNAIVYPQAASAADSTAASAGEGLISCGVSGNINWNTTSGTFQVIRQCSFTSPQSGYVFISANSSLALMDGEYEGQFEIGIDSTAGDSSTDRWINIYTDAGDGTDKSVAISVLKPVAAGVHTFYFLGARYAGAGTVTLYDPTLTALFIPVNNSQVGSCGDSGNVNWTTTSAAFQIIRQCTFTAPQTGYVLISADGGVARQDGEYEGQFEIGIDSAAGDANIDRWVNVYNDAGDGTDKAVALSVLKPVAAGAHTFYSLGARPTGAGTMLVYDPTLTVIFIPVNNSLVQSCGVSGNADWTTTSAAFQIMRQCTFTAPQSGFVFISTDGGVARQDGEYEGQFEIGIDSTAGDANIDRWVNVYNDAGDGTDEAVALSVLKPVAAGAHTVYSLGRRYAGAGTMLVYDPTLTIIYISSIWQNYMPILVRN